MPLGEPSLYRKNELRTRATKRVLDGETQYLCLCDVCTAKFGEEGHWVTQRTHYNHRKARERGVKSASSSVQIISTTSNRQKKALLISRDLHGRHTRLTRGETRASGSSGGPGPGDSSEQTDNVDIALEHEVCKGCLIL
jgi:hypothetical protein